MADRDGSRRGSLGGKAATVAALPFVLTGAAVAAVLALSRAADLTGPGRTAAAAVAAIVALAVAWIVTRRFVMRLVRELGAIEADLDGLTGNVTESVTGADELDRVTRKAARVATELTAREAELQASLERLQGQIVQRQAAERRLRTRVERERAVGALGALATGAAPLHEVCAAAVSALQTHLDADLVVVGEVRSSGFAVLSQVGMVDPRPSLSWLGPDGRLLEATVRAAGPIRSDDLATEARIPLPDGLSERMRSAVIAPFGPDGPLGGMAAALARRASAWDDDDLDFICALGVVLDAAMELARSHAGLLHQAHHDPITGLPNRLAIVEHLEAALATDEGGVTVLFVDVDRLKVINDSRGHATGDRLLGAIGRRLRDAARPDDLVARYSGDEFVVCCNGLDADRAAAMGSRLLACIDAPFVLDEHYSAHVTVSIGIAVADDGTTADELLRDADLAMYRAKADGRGRVSLFDHSQRLAAIAAGRVEHELHDALALGQLVLHLQPELVGVDAHPVAAEALLRWKHPDRGLLLPEDFLEIAEESGLIDPIGEWVFDETCRLATDPALGLRGLGMWCNVAARQLADPGFAEKVGRSIRRWSVPPGSVGIEVTEHALIGDPEAAEEVLRAVHALGVAIAIDDFGTGYSSLAYLKRFPVDVVKIDRRFVDGIGHDPEDTAIVTAVIGLARALGLLVVAEGVETPAQLAELRRLGCDMVQGWLFAPAMAPQQFASWRLTHPGERSQGVASASPLRR